MDNATSCSPGAGGISKGPLTRALIKEVLVKFLAEIGYECPEGELNKFVHTATPVSSRVSSNIASFASNQNSSRSQSPSKGKNKRKARSSSSEEDETCSDSTVGGSDGESESDSASSATSTTERLTRSRSHLHSPL
ncbi:hypothetical protein EVAR_56319_1 [Eumeta japonica]|uniref:Uncharacterized protein n=1 Tax=Eumeta variegata TaxID=151549 RepID=A0A4C1YF32_EUMVA|nr:hypothetical protein EVAR_56319_1 [Eumeta japonica]